MGGSHGVDQWKGLVHALLRGHWENIPAELRAGLDSLLKLPPKEPSKNERVAEMRPTGGCETWAKRDCNSSPD